MKKFISIYTILYILVGLLGTLVTVWFKPLDFGIIAIPPSSWLMGFTFILITIIEDKHGPKVASKMIWILLAITAILCIALDFHLSLVYASGIAFLIGQFMTKFSYNSTGHRLLSSWTGSAFDVLFWVLLGLSPLGIGAVPWKMLPFAIVGQLLVQMIMQFLAGKVYQNYLQK